MNIIPVIRELLLRNQKAVIPGLGAFVIAQRPAQLNKVTRVLSPPALTVKFDPKQQSDDGQLSGYLTRKLNLDQEATDKAISEFTRDIGERLRGDDPVTLEGLGVLTKKKSGDIGFSPEEELLKRISVFEMPAIEVPPPPVQKTVPPPVKAPVSAPVSTSVTAPVTEKTKVTVPQPVIAESVRSYNGNRKWIVPVVLAGLLLGMLVVIYFTGNMSSLVSDVKSVFTANTPDTAKQLVFGNDTENQGDTLTTQISRELDDKVDRQNALSYDKPEAETPQNKIVTGAAQAEASPQKSANYAKLFHIIAGSFTVLSNAEKQRSTLQAKGISAEILPKKGNYYMVSLGSFDTSGEAAAERQKLQTGAGMELWVMKNK